MLSPLKYIIKELTMISIPVTVLNVGYSPSNMTQLRIAPSIGLMRRHILMSETLLPLVCKAMNQKLKAKTEMKTSVPKHIKTGRFSYKAMKSLSRKTYNIDK